MAASIATSTPIAHIRLQILSPAFLLSDLSFARSCTSCISLARSLLHSTNMSLKETLAGRVLVQDGAMGTELEALVPVGHPLSVKGLPLWSTKMLLAEPSWVTDIHKKYVDAGCDMLITTTYQASEWTMKKHENMELPQIQEVWQQAVVCAKNAVADAKRKIYIAGSIGPYGAYLANGAEYSGNYEGKSAAELAVYHESIVKFYVENADVDLIAFETIPNFDEVKGIYALLRKLYTDSYNKEFYLNLSCKNATTLADGTPLSTVIEYIVSQNESVVGKCFVATGCNCVPYEIVASIAENINETCQKIGAEPLNLVVYPNLGFDNDMSDTSQYAFRSSTDGWTKAIRQWKSIPNVRVIGGCCSTGPNEVASIRDAIDD